MLPIYFWNIWKLFWYLGILKLLKQKSLYSVHCPGWQQQGQDNKNKTARKAQSEKDSQERTARIGQPEQDSQDGQAGLDSQDKWHESQDRYSV